MFFEDSDLKNDEIYLKILYTEEKPSGEDEVPYYKFNIVRTLDNNKIGECTLRVGYNESMYYRGNVGFLIFEEFRGRHYASKVIPLILKQAKKHNMPYIIITCEESNIASYKSIKQAGGEYIETKDVPKNLIVYKTGGRRKCIFKFILQY